MAIWAKLFQLSRPGIQQGQPDVDQLDMFDTGQGWFDVESNLLFQSCMGSLSLVCKTFHSVFKAHPGIFSHMSVSNSMLIKAESSTVACLQAQGHVLRSFHGPADPAQATKCLMALSHANSGLQFIWMDLIASSKTQVPITINALGSFRALTTCRLRCSFGTGLPPLDLTPLQGLQKLTRLWLEQGMFVNIDVARHLSFLALKKAKAYGQNAASALPWFRSE